MVQHQYDPAFREALIQRYLPAQDAAAVRQAEAKRSARTASMQAQSERENAVLQEQQSRKQAARQRDLSALTMVLGTYLAAFALLVTWRLMCRRALPAHAPGWSFQAGGRGASFDVFTGIVSDHRQRSETHVSSWGGNNKQPLRTLSRVVADKFLLKPEHGGADMPVRLSNVDMLLFNGQKIGLIQGRKTSGELSPPLRLVNVSSKQVATTLGTNIARQWGLVWPWFVPALLSYPVAVVVLRQGGSHLDLLHLVLGGSVLVLAGLVWLVNYSWVWSRLNAKLDALAQQVLAAPQEQGAPQG